MASAAAPAANHGDTLQSLSPSDIIRLAQYHTTAPLHPFLLSTSCHDTLVSHLRTLPPSIVSEYTSSLLSILSPSPSVSTLLTSLLNSYTILFISEKIPHDRHSLKTIRLFTAHLDNIPITQLQIISDSIVSGLLEISRDPDEAQLLELLPKCLHIIYNTTEIDKPRDVVNAVFDRILDCNWSKILLVKLVSIIREFHFVDKVMGSQFVQKVFDNMHCVELQDLPSLVYQLLVLASKGFNKREVIEGIVTFFGTKLQLRKASASIIREVEGTVLLHVNFVVKQDPSLGQEIMGLVRSRHRVIDHFVVGLLLSIARIRRYSESSMGTLKTALTTAYKDYKFSRYIPHHRRRCFSMFHAMDDNRSIDLVQFMLRDCSVRVGYTPKLSNIHTLSSIPKLESESTERSGFGWWFAQKPRRAVVFRWGLCAKFTTPMSIPLL